MALDPGISTAPVKLSPGELPHELFVTASANEHPGAQLRPRTQHDAQLANGVLSRQSEEAAHAAFRENGCLLLRGAFPPALAEAMHREYLAQFGALDLAGMRAESAKPPPNRFLEVGEARYDITLRMTGAFGRQDVFANPLLIDFLRPLLGRDMHLSNFTTVVSHPGATLQHAHRDCAHLFSEAGVGANLPVYAVNVAVPLIDVDIETGPTGVWLGSHRTPQIATVQDKAMKASTLQRGDCLLLDYRTLHAGMRNLSRQARPIVYMVYARSWFFDDVNHVKRIPLDLPLEDYEKLPPSVQPLLIRALTYATRARWHEADSSGSRRNGGETRGAPALRPRPDQPAFNQQTTAKNPSGGKLGRNEPCPCGSGRKYKQCHGRLA
jgi:hypothetical protein